jgi:hypothetical protein
MGGNGDSPPRAFYPLEMRAYSDDAHRVTEHFKALGAKMGAFLDGRPEIQRLTEL